MQLINPVYAEIELARRHLIDFIKYTKKDYTPQFFHEHICSKLDDFIAGKIKRLIINLPPQHGKSEITSRNLSAYIFGKNPNAKIVAISYSKTMAKGFSLDVKRVMKKPEYRQVFPSVSIKDTTKKDAHGVNTQNEWDIADHSGHYFTTGANGGVLTGKTVKYGIIDDPIEGEEQANSPVQRRNLIDWYESDYISRVTNETQTLIVMTRWHPDDLVGHLLKKEPEKWEVIKYEAIRTDMSDPNDPRKEGEALWEAKVGLEILEDNRKRNPIAFQGLYQQNPRPKEGLLYNDFKIWKELPENGVIRACVDTAGVGLDNLCSIVYYVAQTPLGKEIYILDVVYTKAPPAETQNMVAIQLNKHRVSSCLFESNGIGDIFADDVKKVLRTKMHNNICSINKKFNSKNKEQRIYSMCSIINETFYMPLNWHSRFPEFYDEIVNFRATIKANEFDDGADTITAIAEKELRQSIVLM